MEDDGIEKFFKDMGINVETDIIFYVIAKYMGAKQNGEFSFDEFKKGCEVLGCDTIAAWKNTIQN